jgi:hypothetical protein
MSQSAAIAAFYDREQDPASERDSERSAYDWGAGDLFETMPRPRRHGARTRGAVATAGPTRTREHAPQHLHVVATPAIEPVIEVDPAHEALLRPRMEPPTTPGGRRTVTVTGRPDPVPVVRTRRPAPTAADRIAGTRPDRVAGWAFAMGMLLILIAFLTAGA